MLKLFGATIFLGAALLFVVQPMIARMVLPLLGGSPSVWNGCMLFFQGVLLAGYLYAHAVGSVRQARPQAALHAVILLASVAWMVVFPPGIPRDAAPPSDGSPVLWMVAALAQGIGVPFLMLSTGSSLLQRFFSRTDHPAASDPYFLYAASNAGSMLGLLGYPIVIEPVLTLGQQRWLFATGYTLWVGLTIICAVTALRRQAPVKQTKRQDPLQTRGDASPAITIADRGRWVLLAFVPSSLLLSATLFITTDVAPVPLLWVLPLAAYLLTFIVAFWSRGATAVRWARWLTIPAVAGLEAIVFAEVKHPLPGVVGMHLLVLFIGGLACHGRLAAARPAVSGLTEFYLWIAVGGVAGGIFNTIVAPVLFVAVDEYAIALALLCVVAIPDLPNLARKLNLTLRWAAAVVVCGSMVYSARRVGIDSAVMHRERTFFGVYRVMAWGGGYAHSLYHGTTLHGRQAYGHPDSRGVRSGNERFMPMTYYHPAGPIGELFLRKSDDQPPGFGEVGLVGLGVGTLAAYGRDKSQHFTFYEIDPAVVRMASNREFFTFLADSDATVSTVVGDARLMLAKEPNGKFDLLVIDAFSSDAIPVHLLTRDAFEIYMAKLKPDGVLAVHITNRYLNLQPVVGNIARSMGLVAFVCRDLVSDRITEVGQQQMREGKAVSVWTAVARNVRALGPLAGEKRWTRFENLTGGRPWTDDYSNILGVLAE